MERSQYFDPSDPQDWLPELAETTLQEVTPVCDDERPVDVDGEDYPIAS